MVITNGMKTKYAVIKMDDIYRYLSKDEQNLLGNILLNLHYGRINDGKKSNTYLVVNTDEVYADKLVQIMKEHGHWG